MKTIGIIIFSVGIITMGIAAVDFLNKKNKPHNELAAHSPLSFPWKPTGGAILMAIGIIMMGAKSKKRVM